MGWKFYNSNGELLVSSNPASIDHGLLAGLADDDHPQYVLHTEVDDVSVNGATTDPISSNWAFDHENDAGLHSSTLVFWPSLLLGGM